MEQLRQLAFEIVLRACGFGSLAIFCIMVGMSFEPRFAFQAGGFLTTAMALILYYKAQEARWKDYRKTELWLYVPDDYKVQSPEAQWVSSIVMRETYLTFGMWTAAIAVAMWAIALIFWLAGF